MIISKDGRGGEFHKNVNHLMLAGIIGAMSIGLNYAQKIASKVEIISEAVIESKATNQLRFAQIFETLTDHEGRIRVCEKLNTQRRL